MSDKRRAERRPVRIRVRFWRPGQPDVVHQGYTTNISGTGAFVQTEHPHPKGRRLQIEFTTEHSGFVTEALVARSIKVAPELHSVRPSGMGLRFLSVEELLAGFLPKKGDAGGAASALAGHSSASDPDQAPTPAQSEQDAVPAEPDADNKQAHKPREIEVTAPKVARHHPAAPPPRPNSEQDSEEQSREQVETPADTSETAGTGTPPKPLVFRLTPPSLEVVRSLYERQIAPGVLLLPSRTDCEVGRSVRVELKTPPSPQGQRIFSFEGEVLECGHVDSRGGSTLRVKIRENSTADEFLRRILGTSTT